MFFFMDANKSWFKQLEREGNNEVNTIFTGFYLPLVIFRHN